MSVGFSSSTESSKEQQFVISESDACWVSLGAMSDLHYVKASQPNRRERRSRLLRRPDLAVLVR